ncbi:MAG: hypothetical protein ABJP34_10570 [Erythrobacter sp.]
METITETRPQSQPTKTAFQVALDTWIARRDALNLCNDDARSDELGDLLFAAERALLKQPVNNISDLRSLSEVIWQDPHSYPSDALIAVFFKALRGLDNNAESATFNAANWLSHFERFGGGWVETDGAVKLVHPVEQSDAMDDLIWELETRDGLKAVKAAILAKAKQLEEPVCDWAKLLSAFQTADLALAAHGDETPHPAGSPENEAREAKTDALVDASTDALVTLMRFPSPDGTAYRTKAKLYADHHCHDWNEAHEFAQILASEAERLAA